MNKEIILSNPQADMVQTVSATSLFMAGVGSGKTHGIAVESAEYIENFPYIFILIAANTYGQLSNSTLKGVFRVWKDLFGWEQYSPETGLGNYVVDIRPPKHFERLTEPLKSYKNIISFDNGSMTLTASLDNYKVLDGTEFGVAFLDETKDTKEEAVKDVVSARLRQKGLWRDSNGFIYGLKHYNAYIASGRWVEIITDESISIYDYKLQETIKSYNPLKIYTSPAKVEWLNTWFGLTDYYEEIGRKIHEKNGYFKLETAERCVIISSTYHNARNLPGNYISDMVDRYKNNPNLIEMQIYGSPIAKGGSEFIPSFSRIKHVLNDGIKLNKRLPIHSTWDFNVDPYMTCLLGQYEPNPNGYGGTLRIIDEICLEPPRNKTAEVCTDIKRYAKKAAGLFIYGDPSGRNRQTVSTEYTDNYDVIKKHLDEYLNNYSDRVQYNHPGILTSRDFLTDLFGINSYGIALEISYKCKNLIHDLEYCKQDKNGKMIKPTALNKQTGKTVEKMGHCLDALRYLVCSLFEEYYEESKK